ncbi:MAG TPA: UDP-3-O-(3-hydroxymyristoyl)glucosamine N-acyltransferase [Verrucomicrobiae bacterium]
MVPTCMTTLTITAQALAKALGGSLEGNGGLELTDVAPIAAAGPANVTFAENPKSFAEAYASAAGVVLVSANAPASAKTLIRVENCRDAFARAMLIFHPPRQYPGVVDASAHIGAGVKLGKDICIGQNVVLGEGVQVGDRTVILANCVIGEQSTLGENCLLYPNVTIYSGVKLGDRVMVHSGTVIGGDGFGYARNASGIVKIPQIGGVIIEDDVEIGVNVSIDRATMISTIIGRGTKIDNQVQIAHNVIIGKNCLIAGQCGIGGSARLGENVTLAGGVAVVDHVEIGANAVVGALSLVTKDVPPGGVVWGMPAQPARKAKRQNAALRRLPDLLKRLLPHDE